MELHVFVDGSEEAYAMGAYLRSKHSGHIGPSPVTATATVAPLKAITIPRMRPSVVDRQKWICDDLEFKTTKRILWCDSQTILYRTRRHSKKMQTIVARLLGQVDQLTKKKNGTGPNKFELRGTIAARAAIYLLHLVAEATNPSGGRRFIRAESVRRRIRCSYYLISTSFFFILSFFTSLSMSESILSYPWGWENKAPESSANDSISLTTVAETCRLRYHLV